MCDVTLCSRCHDTSGSVHNKGFFPPKLQPLWIYFALIFCNLFPHYFCKLKKKVAPSSCRSALFPCGVITVKGPRKFAYSLPPFLCCLLQFCLLASYFKGASCFIHLSSCCLVTLPCAMSLTSSQRAACPLTLSRPLSSSALLSSCEQMFLKSFSPFFEHYIVLAPVFGCVCHQLAESSKTISFDNSQIKQCMISLFIHTYSKLNMLVLQNCLIKLKFNVK